MFKLNYDIIIFLTNVDDNNIISLFMSCYPCINSISAQRCYRVNVEECCIYDIAIF